MLSYLSIPDSKRSAQISRLFAAFLIASGTPPATDSGRRQHMGGDTRTTRSVLLTKVFIILVGG